MIASKVDRLAQLATIFGALITAGSVIFGVMTYRRSAAEERQALALGMLQEYLRLSIEHPDLAYPENGRAINSQYEAFVTHAMATAENLWVLVGSDPRWERSIAIIVRSHRDYLAKGVLHCENYQPDFLKALQQRTSEIRCAFETSPGIPHP